MRHSIFIGYRREDAAHVAGRIYDRLTSAFGKDAVFIDVDDVPYGADFRAHIVALLKQCRCFIAVIGPRWSATRADGLARLQDLGDVVRIELETALQTDDLKIFPALVNGATMPGIDDLPSSLVPITRLNAANIRDDPDFHKDMDRLIAELGATLGDEAVRRASKSSRPKAAWDLIDESLDPRDYIAFQEHFRGQPEVLVADQRLRQLAAFDKLDKSNPKQLTEFAQQDLFSALRSAVVGQLERIEAAAQKQMEVDEARTARDQTRDENLLDKQIEASGWRAFAGALAKAESRRFSYRIALAVTLLLGTVLVLWFVSTFRIEGVSSWLIALALAIPVGAIGAGGIHVWAANPLPSYSSFEDLFWRISQIVDGRNFEASTSRSLRGPALFGRMDDDWLSFRSEMYKARSARLAYITRMLKHSYATLRPAAEKSEIAWLYRLDEPYLLGPRHKQPRWPDWIPASRTVFANYWRDFAIGATSIWLASGFFSAWLLGGG